MINLTNNDDIAFAPTWSPDGSKIAFAMISGEDFDIYVMDADGGVPARLTPDLGVVGFHSWGISTEAASVIQAMTWARIKGMMQTKTDTEKDGAR